MNGFFPEGFLIDSQNNKSFLINEASLSNAKSLGIILESKATLCDKNHNLIVDLDCMEGFIPRDETSIGIREGTTRDIAIISRVNKSVCFVVDSFEKKNDGKTRVILSRRKAQEMCMREKILNLKQGDIIDAIVTHMENFGTFVDIGCGIVSFLPIDMISVSRISHPNERFKNGMKIKVIVKSVLGDRINLTHKELLGTWEENCKEFEVGQTVPGIVRSIEDYGIFVELKPNLAGLAEPKEGIFKGQQISVYIKNIIPEKMKIKLVIIESFESKATPQPFKYFFKGNHMNEFIYSPISCTKSIGTNFLTRNLDMKRTRIN